MKIILENMDDIDNYLRIFYTPTGKVKPDSRALQEHSMQTAHLAKEKKVNHLTLVLTRKKYIHHQTETLSQPQRMPNMRRKIQIWSWLIKL
jgi:hypothetical protein